MSAIFTFTWKPKVNGRKAEVARVAIMAIMQTLPICRLAEQIGDATIAELVNPQHRTRITAYILDKEPPPCESLGSPMSLALYTILMVLMDAHLIERAHITNTPGHRDVDMNTQAGTNLQRLLMFKGWLQATAAEIAETLCGQKLDEGEQTLTYDELIRELPTIQELVAAYKVGQQVIASFGNNK